MSLSLCKCLISLSLKTPLHVTPKPHFSSYTTKTPKPSVTMTDYLITQHGFSPKIAEKASSVRTLIKNPENTDSVLQFLKQNGFSNTHLHKLVEHLPTVLFASLEKTIKPKLKLFQDLGFTSNEFADIVSLDPWILNRSIDQQLLPSLLVLKNVLGSTEDIYKVLKISGWFLKHDLSKTMMPNIEFLLSCGVDKSQLNKTIFNFPRLFVLKPDSIKEYVRRADELGVDRNAKMFIYAVRTLSSMSIEKWELKLDVFRSLGFLENEISIMFMKKPMAFAVSGRKINMVVEYLTGMRQCDIRYLVDNPTLLIYSLEGRIKPRIKVFDTLKRKDLVSRDFSLSFLCRITDAEFFERFVAPYKKEVGHLYAIKKVVKSFN